MTGQSGQTPAVRASSRIGFLDLVSRVEDGQHILGRLESGDFVAVPEESGQLHRASPGASRKGSWTGPLRCSLKAQCKLS